MEHLPELGGKASQLSHTILLRDDVLYDGGPFLTYPERDGWPAEFRRALRSPHALALQAYEKRNPTSQQKFESFLQRWLFFGLLTELLGNDFKSSIFVADPALDSEVPEGYHGNPKFLTTDKLAPLVMSWVQQVQSGQATCPYPHVAACLQAAYRALLATGSGFDAGLKVCLASVCEVFEFAANIAFDIQNLATNNQCPAAWCLASGLSYWDTKYQGLSWCPYQAQRILQSALSIQTLHFMSLLGEQRNVQKHDGCGPDKCMTSQVDLASYRTQHFTSECQCDFIEVDGAVMQSILQDGSYPLLRIKKDDKSVGLGVELLAASPEVPFVALSHVWADGLGNPRANALPRCQLAALHEWICQLQGPTSEADHVREVLLWCDTMCCPRKPIEARRMAISCMHRAYKEASYVLVLDKYMRAFPLESMNADEIYARITTSNWSKRMWTLQEGALPRSHDRVVFQFRNSCISMKDLRNHSREDLYKNPLRHGLSLDMFSFFEEIRSKSINEAVPAITRMSMAFKNRKVSYTDDEPLLLGMMLDLDVSHILRGPDETRMQRMWSLMPAAHGGIPEGVIFRAGKRLSARGFRWAPATFLDNSEPIAEMMVPVRQMRLGIPTDRGLLVSMTGYKIEFSKSPFQSNPWGVVRQAAGALVLRGTDKYYLMISTGENHLSPIPLVQLAMEERSLYIIHPRDKFQPDDDDAQGATTALVVQLDSQDQANGTRYVRSLSHIALGLLPRPNCNLLEAAYRCASQLATSDAGRRYLQSDSAPEGVEIAVGEDLVTELHRLVMDLDNDVIDSARSYAGQNVRDLLESEAVLLLCKGYMTIGPRLTDSQQWCVD